MNVWWVPVLCAIVSASVGFVTWYRRRRDALIESSRRAAIAELECSGEARDEPLVRALVNRDADSVADCVEAHPAPATLALAQAKRFADGALNASAQDFRLFGWAIGFPLTLVIILIHSVGAASVEVKAENDAARARDHQMRVIGLTQMVSHIDSGFGHTVVLVVYRPGLDHSTPPPTSSRTVRSRTRSGSSAVAGTRPRSQRCARYGPASSRTATVSCR